MDELGWDSCDVIIVTGDAYVDHPSFGMAIIGRLLEAHGFRVGIIAQPDWRNKDDFQGLGQPNLFVGITSGNMDSMINRYTADLKRRSDDAYTPNGEADKRPDRAVLAYAQRCREAFKGTPILLGGIEASLRRIAHYDYWSNKVRRSVLVDAKADMLLYGNAERAIVDIAHRLAQGESINDINDVRGTVLLRKHIPECFLEISATTIPDDQVIRPSDTPSQIARTNHEQQALKVIDLGNVTKKHEPSNEHAYIKLPSYEQVKADQVLYAHASRVFHLETNPHNARALLQQHADKKLWINPPPIPLTTEELDSVFELPFARQPHPHYGKARMPAFEMIRFSINIMRGCFGGCSFCSITEHEGRIIQNRSEESIIREIKTIRDTATDFTGVISDLGGPTANMWQLACRNRKTQAHCRRPSCVYPEICKNLGTDQTPLIELYQKARTLPGIKKVLIASGLRYDLAIRSPAYVKELVTHHVGGYLKIAPEHTEKGPLSKMMKPGMDSYERFTVLFNTFSKQAGKEQYLIPYFIAAHPGTTDSDMLQLALWLKRHKFRIDQVQTFYPSPLANATTMYHSGRNPLKRISRQSEKVFSAKGLKQRRLHKAFLRYHAPENWPLLRDALRHMGRADLIGNAKHQLIPRQQLLRTRSSSVNTGITGHNQRQQSDKIRKKTSANRRAQSKKKKP